RQGLAQEVDDRYALHLLGVLEGEEHARLAADLGVPVRDVVALEADGAAGDLVLGGGQERGSEGGLTRAVGAHQGVDLARLDGEIDALEDLGCVGDAYRTGAEALDL